MTSITSQLVPIRIDAVSHDKSSRLIDTLLFDPHCWPIPLFVTTPKVDDPEQPNDDSKGSKTTRFEQSISSWLEANVQYLTDQILNDAEVTGMGRTVRHFTNRVDLWNHGLHRGIADQIRQQLEPIAYQAYTIQSRQRFTNNTSSSKDDIKSTHNSSSSKRKANDGANDETEKPSAKRIKTEHADTAESSSSTSTHPLESTSTKDEEGDTKMETEEISKDKEAAKHKEKDGAKPVDVKEVLQQVAVTCQTSCIPIRIRLSAYGVRIHDDFYYDPKLGSKTSPLDLAQAIGKDLKLPDELIIALAVNIAEQIGGLNVTPAESDVSPAVQPTEDDGGPKDRRNLTAAWELESRVHVSNVAHLVHQHRQDVQK